MVKNKHKVPSYIFFSYAHIYFLYHVHINNHKERSTIPELENFYFPVLVWCFFLSLHYNYKVKYYFTYRSVIMKNLRNLLKKFTVVTLLAALLFSKPLKTISPYTNINNIILNGFFFSEIDEF